MGDTTVKSIKIDASGVTAGTKVIVRDFNKIIQKSRDADKRIEELEKTIASMGKKAKSSSGSLGALSRDLATVSGAGFRAAAGIGAVTKVFRMLGPGGTAAAIATLGVAKALTNLTRVVNESTEVWKNFEYTMAQVNGILGGSDATFKQLNKSASEYARTTLYTTKQVAEGMKFLAMAGLEANQVLASMPAVMSLATASGLNLAKTADIATNAMTTFGKSASDLQEIGNVLLKVTTGSNTNITQLASALKYAGSAANAFGYSIEDTASLIGALGDAGIQASTAGTSLRMAFTRLDKAWAAMGKDGSGKDLVDTIIEMKNMGMQAGEVIEIFGKRAGNAMLALGNNIGKFYELQAATGSSIDKMKELEDQMMSTQEGLTKLIDSAEEATKKGIGEELDATLKKLLTAQKEYLETSREIVTDIAVAWGTLLTTIQTYWTKTKTFTLGAITNIKHSLQGLGEVFKGNLGLEEWVTSDAEELEAAVGTIQKPVNQLKKSQEDLLQLQERLKASKATGGWIGGSSVAVEADILEKKEEIAKLQKKVDDEIYAQKVDQVKKEDAAMQLIIKQQSAEFDQWKKREGAEKLRLKKEKDAHMKLEAERLRHQKSIGAITETQYKIKMLPQLIPGLKAAGMGDTEITKVLEEKKTAIIMEAEKERTALIEAEEKKRRDIRAAEGEKIRKDLASRYKKEEKMLIDVVKAGQKAEKLRDKFLAAGGDEASQIYKDLTDEIERAEAALIKLNEEHANTTAVTSLNNDLLQNQLKEQVKAREDAFKEEEKLRKKQEKEWEEYYDNIVDFGTEAIIGIWEDGSDGFDDMLDKMYDNFKKTVAKMAMEKVVLPIVTELLGGTGGGLLSELLGGIMGGGSQPGGSGGTITSIAGKILSPMVTKGMDWAKEGWDSLFSDASDSMSAGIDNLFDTDFGSFMDFGEIELPDINIEYPSVFTNGGVTTDSSFLDWTPARTGAMDTSWLDDGTGHGADGIPIIAHPGEMIVPAKNADFIRDLMAANGMKDFTDLPKYRDGAVNVRKKKAPSTADQLIDVAAGTAEGYAKKVVVTNVLERADLGDITSYAGAIMKAVEGDYTGAAVSAASQYAGALMKSNMFGPLVSAVMAAVQGNMTQGMSIAGGAAVGSAIPGVGTAIGALIGGILGGFSGGGGGRPKVYLKTGAGYEGTDVVSSGMIGGRENTISALENQGLSDVTSSKYDIGLRDRGIKGDEWMEDILSFFDAALGVMEETFDVDINTLLAENPLNERIVIGEDSNVVEEISNAVMGSTIQGIAASVFSEQDIGGFLETMNIRQLASAAAGEEMLVGRDRAAIDVDLAMIEGTEQWVTALAEGMDLIKNATGNWVTATGETSKEFEAALFGAQRSASGRQIAGMPDTVDATVDRLLDEVNNVLTTTEEKLKHYESTFYHPDLDPTRGMVRGTEGPVSVAGVSVIESREATKEEKLLAQFGTMGLYEELQKEGESIMETTYRVLNTMQEIPDSFERIIEMADAGLTTVEAIGNFEKIKAAKDEVDAVFAAFGDVGTVTALQDLVQANNEYKESLYDLYATAEEIDYAGRAGNLAVGTSITGLDAETSSAMFWESITSGEGPEGFREKLEKQVREGLAKSVVASLSEAMTNAFIAPLNEAVGSIMTDLMSSSLFAGEALKMGGAGAANELAGVLGKVTDQMNDLAKIMASPEVMDKFKELYQVAEDFVKAVAPSSINNTLSMANEDLESIADNIERLLQPFQDLIAKEGMSDTAAALYDLNAKYLKAQADLDAMYKNASRADITGGVLDPAADTEVLRKAKAVEMRALAKPFQEEVAEILQQDLIDKGTLTQLEVDEKEVNDRFDNIVDSLSILGESTVDAELARRITLDNLLADSMEENTETMEAAIKSLNKATKSAQEKASDYFMGFTAAESSMSKLEGFLSDTTKDWTDTKTFADAMGLLGNAYSDAVDAAIKAAEDMAKALESAEKSSEGFGKSIDNLLKDLKYGTLNVALGSTKAEEAQKDYDILLEAAMGGDQIAIQEFLDFVPEYLQMEQDTLKSSDKYVELFEDVQKDLAGVGGLRDWTQSKEYIDLQMKSNLEELNRGIKLDPRVKAFFQDEMSKINTLFQESYFDPLQGYIGTLEGIRIALENLAVIPRADRPTVTDPADLPAGGGIVISPVPPTDTRSAMEKAGYGSASEFVKHAVSADQAALAAEMKAAGITAKDAYEAFAKEGTYSIPLEDIKDYLGPGFSDGGWSRGPESGYPALLHGDEYVMTSAEYGEVSRLVASAVESGGSGSGMTREQAQKLIEQNERLIRASEATADFTADISQKGDQIVELDGDAVGRVVKTEIARGQRQTERGATRL